MDNRISKYYSQLTSIRDSLETILDELDEDEVEYEILDSAVDNLGQAIEDLEEIVPGNSPNITFILE